MRRGPRTAWTRFESGWMIYRSYRAICLSSSVLAQLLSIFVGSLATTIALAGPCVEHPNEAISKQPQILQIENAIFRHDFLLHRNFQRQCLTSALSQPGHGDSVCGDAR